MDRRKAGFLEGHSGSTKFLARYRSQPLPECCFCCPSSTEQLDPPLLDHSTITIVPTLKISIKEINKNRLTQGITHLHWRTNNGNRSR